MGVDKPVFGAYTYFAKRHPGELCGSNGLPLTPNSITILGRSQILKTVQHPHLCEHLDVIRGKHERIIVVSEHYNKNIQSIPCPVDINQIKKIAKAVCSALSHLNSKGIVHRALAPDNILLDQNDNIKLFNYGLYYMSNHNKCVLFPVGNPKYIAPEVYLINEKTISGPKVDIWSLGIILAELALNKIFWSDLKLGQVIRRILSLVNCSVTVFEHLANTHNCTEVYKNLPQDIKDFINKCLSIELKDRPMPKQLLQHTFVSSQEEVHIDTNDYGYHIGFLERVSKENAVFIKKMQLLKQRKESNEVHLPSYEDHKMKAIGELYDRSLKEVYHLWQLAGGDAYSELKKQGMIKSNPPILTLCSLVLLEGTAFGERRDLASMLDLKVIPLSMDSLHQRLSHLPLEAYHPLIETNSAIIGKEMIPEELPSLPLVIRERDTEYQFHRIILFQRLLTAYPYKAESIQKEAEKDIPPFYRGRVWAALLGVTGDVQATYAAIDKETATHTDRQIEVDIPRCHQYDELLSSAEGHRKLKRVLKAWVISHPQYVYWQGLDSLCAPFLYLNFNNEALAYACLSSFIPKYLHDLFLKDNSSVIQEYLAKFRQLIAFHDPALANHLDDISFIPELFSIPWFLTVFSHVFPLHKIFHLWDKLLLGDSSFPLYVGLAVLTQLRDTLLTSGFNECILLFSDLPEVDMERCVRESVTLYESTPRSICYRQHSLPSLHMNQDMSKNPPSVTELQKEFCPRISASDLLYLIDVNDFSTEKVVLIVDARSVDCWIMETVRNSVNIPFNTVSLSELQVPSTKEGNTLEESKGKVIVVVGSGGENLAEFCKWLVQCGFPKVCSLHGGIQALAGTGVLVAPTH